MSRTPRSTKRTPSGPPEDPLLEAVLHKVFGEERAKWRDLGRWLTVFFSASAPQLRDALDQARDRLAAAPPSEERTRIIENALVLIGARAVHGILPARGRGLARSDRGPDRLIEVLDGRPDDVPAVIRTAASMPRKGDEERVRRLVAHLGEKEITTMSMWDWETRHSGFAFDERNLPPFFREEKEVEVDDGKGGKTKKKVKVGQAVYVAAVEKAMENIGRKDGLWVPAMIGLLLQDGHYDPTSEAFYKAIQRNFSELVSSASSDSRVPLKVDGETVDLHLPDGHMTFVVFEEVAKRLKTKGNVFFNELAAIGRQAVSKYDRRPPKDPGFDRTVDAISVGFAGGGGGGFGRVELPPLSDPAGGSDEIEPDNIRSVAVIYLAFQLEQMRLFQVVDRIVELFMAGLLPLGYDNGARMLDDFYWRAHRRLNQVERFAQYGRALGVSGGQVSQDINPNTEFGKLLLRFISSVAEFERQQSVGNLFDGRTGRALTTSGEYVRKAGRDLAANVSLYGWAGTHFAAERIATHVREAMDILQLPQIKQSYGVTTLWQVIERVSAQEFGQTVNVVKHRTLADETRKILNLIADKHAVWSLTSPRDLFTINKSGPTGDLTYEESRLLFRSVQYWLAVNGIRDQQVDEYAQPTPTIAAPSLPALGADGVGGFDPGAVDELRDMVARGEAPSLDQLRTMLPSM